MTVKVEPLTGEALRTVLPALARLRITVFRAYPYLYDGSLAYEENYIRKFAEADGTVIVVASDGGTIVGASTASPMDGHADEFAAAFRQHGYDTSKIFYFGESVLLPQYRGQGIGHAFFDHREARARELGGFTHTTFCGVVRPADHPLKPKDYVPLDGFWTKRGYRKLDGVTATYRWKDIDKPDADDKTMQFWIRPL
jgi:GNAT superfamily N-acetyltransferase